MTRSTRPTQPRYIKMPARGRYSTAGVIDPAKLKTPESIIGAELQGADKRKHKPR